MKRGSITMRLLAALFAFALIGAACGGSDDGETAAASNDSADSGSMGSTETNMNETGIDTDAAKLVQGLTDLLDSHVFLAGIAVEQAVITGDPNSAQFKAAAATLDSNSQDLAAAIESVYGADAADQFLELWRAHIGMFVDYTVGGLTGDKAMQKKAGKELDQYRQDFGAFIDTATNGELPKAAVADALQMHVDSLVQAVDAAIAGDPKVFDLLYAAAHEHMPMTASALAGGIIAANPDKF